MRLAPDAYRYVAQAQGAPVPRPFTLRPFLPWLCGSNERLWWRQHLMSWFVMASSMTAWRAIDGDDWRYVLAATVVFLALPGLSGPAIRPIGVDHMACALTLFGVMCLSVGHPGGTAAGVLVICWAAACKESSPVWAALWAWSAWPLLGLVVPLVLWFTVKPGPDPTGRADLQLIADHPVRSSLAARAGRWRDGWLWLAPWGVGLLALYRPSVQLVVLVVVAHLALLLATDTVRLVQFAAGPVVAVAAVSHVPVAWLPLALAAHVMWFRKPEVV